MASRLTSRFTEDLSPQFGDAFRFRSAPARPIEGRQQTPRIPWGTKQVSGLNQPGKFIGRNESDVSRPSSPDDYGLPLVHDLIEHAGQVCTQACICGFSRHEPPCPYCTGFLYGRTGRTARLGQAGQMPIASASIDLGKSRTVTNCLASR
jgi:hypothetical protein